MRKPRPREVKPKAAHYKVAELELETGQPHLKPHHFTSVTPFLFLSLPAIPRTLAGAQGRSKGREIVPVPEKWTLQMEKAHYMHLK